MKRVREEKHGDLLIEVWESFGPLPYGFTMVYRGSTYEFPSVKLRRMCLAQALETARSWIPVIRSAKG